jgi:hypothetical protein
VDSVGNLLERRKSCNLNLVSLNFSLTFRLRSRCPGLGDLVQPFTVINTDPRISSGGFHTNFIISVESVHPKNDFVSEIPKIRKARILNAFRPWVLLANFIFLQKKVGFFISLLWLRVCSHFNSKQLIYFREIWHGSYAISYFVFHAFYSTKVV